MPSTLCFNAPSDELEIDLARLNLGEFFRATAKETTTEIGFGWRGSLRAPSTLRDLTREFRACTITGLPMRVSNRHCLQTIYFSAADNLAFRFVHDTRHVWMQTGFDVNGELLIASCHLARLKAEGYGPGSLEFRLLYADTVGQTLFQAEHGYFPPDQLRFVLRCITGSLADAIAAEHADRAKATT